MVLDLAAILRAAVCRDAQQADPVLGQERDRAVDPVRAQGTICDGHSWYFDAFTRSVIGQIREP